MTDFADLLGKKVEDTTEPPVLPGGTWRLRVITAKYMEHTGKGDATHKVMFVYAASEPLDDVDVDRVAELTDEDFEGARLFYTVFLSDRRDEWKLRKVVEAHGVDMTGRTYEEAFETIAGAEVLGTVTEDVGEDGETPRNNLASVITV